MKTEAPALPDGAEPRHLGDPSEVGRYRLVGRLGFGGMGVVYLGLDADTGERVAVKTLHRADLGDPAVRKRFRAEAACARQIASRRTARVLSDGSDQDPPYLVTEFIDGPTLSRVLDVRGPLQAEALHAVAIGVADALAAIHAAGIVHRDVKPSNVLLDRSGPRLIDFGIARTLDAIGGLTQTGLILGSPGWVAPERLTGGPAATASDVFGWGQLIAYAATGRHPFGPGHPIQGALTANPDLSGLSEPLHSLVEAALAKDPQLRPEASDLLSALLLPRTEQTAELAIASLWDPSQADPEQRTHQGPQRTTRKGRALWTAVGAVVTLAVLLVENLWGGTGAESSNDRVQATASAITPPAVRRVTPAQGAGSVPSTDHSELPAVRRSAPPPSNTAHPVPGRHKKHDKRGKPTK